MEKSKRIKIYNLTVEFPNEEKYTLSSQIKRSTNSISDNLAEGSGRAGNLDKAHFTNIAYSSCLEVVNQLIAANDLGYLDENKLIQLRIEIHDICKMLNALYKFQIKSASTLKEKMKKE